MAWNGTLADLEGSVMWFATAKEAQEWADMAQDGAEVASQRLVSGGTAYAVVKDHQRGVCGVYLQEDGSWRRCWLGW